MKTLTITILTATTLAFIPVCNAANVNWTGGGLTDDWNDVDNWQGSAIAGAAVDDSAIFSGAGDSNTPTTSIAFANATDFNFRNDATLTLDAGVTISNIDQGRTGGNANNDGGHIVQNGGNLSGRALLIASNNNASSRSSHTISSGDVSLTDNYTANSLGDVIMTGSMATISAENINFTEANGVGSTLTFDFDSAGIGSFTTAGGFNAAAASLLTINAAGYTPVLGNTFTLIDADTYTAFVASNITVNGFGAEGVDYTLTQDLGGSGDLVLTIIPEPSSTALLGFGFGALALRRRRA